MKAAVLRAYETPLSMEEVEVLPPGPSEVLVRFAASGVCHSDLTRIQGQRASALPIILGHEGAGIVEAVGPGVTAVGVGDRVVLSWMYGCGQCAYCAAGRPNLCRVGFRMLAEGTFPDGTTRFRRNGEAIHHMVVSSFGEFGVVPEGCAIPIPADVPFERAALIGCSVLTGVGAVTRTARVEAGTAVAVFGCGGVGLNVIQGAVLSGAGRIIAVDVQDDKLELATRFGATHTVRAGRADTVAAVRAAAGGLGADYAFEAIGRKETVGQAYAAIRPGGIAVVVGLMPSAADMVLPGTETVQQEKMLVGSFYGGSRPRIDIPRLIELYRGGRLRLDDLVTRTYAHAEINEALDDLGRGLLARGVVVYA